ncbi:putative C-1-tetrahydrofolate synthase, cytoplasmic [Trypanosoma cruzi]|uniref:C-1-tetrahydrofolate synthase, cytoplasmic, putative n=2 Tax=Trypanosoma cruzi TaxID=5693 RepID=Q4CWE6_TRYCC|nr:C-1-tetrahydrofolate synthase, cytoplasmic, putative [Trypanosoma cruzi]EAN84593.1 C-1-tetrahydrofolate synthase, cytoplasmic, putative [Trypanosoma cruzi]PWV20851.1 putative C-1-tetrahydrofolate synthase, cytoplasmic [Trypanosoma cruzi]RNC49225.1 C-1-tetrahydrofolate synthase, cytoplasmic [Trypanosoma cruzi]|eukprot:XP_806444.1 C-1-tetrahydrofolate synthase, cytoplasmic [Trypanosoma cruzi strain CL Brener]
MSGAVVIDGKGIAETIRAEMKSEVEQLWAKYGRRPGISAIICGERKDSQTYVRLKKKAAEECGFVTFNVELPADVTQEEIQAEVEKLDQNADCHGIIVQLPLPDHIDQDAVLKKISPEKDSDALLPVNVGLLHTKGCEPLFVPCTPAGVIELLKRSGVTMAGKRAVVLGRSNIVGAPVAALLTANNATVTVVHSATPLADLIDVVRSSHIVVAAMGKPGFVRGEWIREGAAVIDVGTTPVDDPSKKAGYRIAGDVCFEEAQKRAGWITPVPGGVGPMTIAMLLKNTLAGFKRSLSQA